MPVQEPLCIIKILIVLEVILNFAWKSSNRIFLHINCNADFILTITNIFRITFINPLGHFSQFIQPVLSIKIIVLKWEAS
jgi:hypothetical protein